REKTQRYSPCLGEGLFRDLRRGPGLTTTSDGIFLKGHDMQKPGAERDLLFGILALQVGLVEQADLIAAFQTWSKDKSRPLEQVLVERGAMTDDDRVMLDGLV